MKTFNISNNKNQIIPSTDKMYHVVDCNFYGFQAWSIEANKKYKDLS
jgi:hypothetical protein